MNNDNNNNNNNNNNVVAHTCEFFIVSKNRKCLRKTKEQYCYQHKQAAARLCAKQQEQEQEAEQSDGDDEDDNTCAICLSSLDANLCHLEPCNHIFHSDCFSKLYTIECPLCRAIPTNVLVSSMKNLNQDWLRRHPNVGRSIEPSPASKEVKDASSHSSLPRIDPQQRNSAPEQHRTLATRILDFLLCRNG